MLRSARFALLAGLAVAIPALVALDPPQHQNKQQTKDHKKKAEPAKQESSSKNSPSDERIDRRNSRMKERNREIDGMLNDKQKR